MLRHVKNISFFFLIIIILGTLLVLENSQQLKEDSTQNWIQNNSRINQEQQFELVSNGTGTVSLISQNIKLVKNEYYHVSFLIKAIEGVNSALPLLVDLQESGFDSPKYDFLIDEHQISKEFRKINIDFKTDDNVPEKANLRLYTLSTKPIQLTSIKLTKDDSSLRYLLILVVTLYLMLLIIPYSKIIHRVLIHAQIQSHKIILTPLVAILENNILRLLPFLWFFSFLINYFYIYETSGPSIFQDELEYFMLSKGIHFFEFESQGALYNPLYPLLGSLFFGFKNNVYAYEGFLILNSLTFSSVIIPFYLISRTFFTFGISLFFSFILFFSPWIGLTRFIWAESIYYSLFVWTFYFFMKFISIRTKRSALAVGVSLGMLYLAKQLALTLTLSIFIVLTLELIFKLINRVQKHSEFRIQNIQSNFYSKLVSALRLEENENHSMLHLSLVVGSFFFIFFAWTLIRMKVFPGNLTGYDNDLLISLMAIKNNFFSINFWKLFLDIIPYYLHASYFIFFIFFIYSIFDFRKLNNLEFILTFTIVLTSALQVFMYVTSFLKLGTVNGVAFPNGMFPYGRYLCTSLPFIILLGLNKIQKTNITNKVFVFLSILAIVFGVNSYYFSLLKSAFVSTVAKCSEIEYLNRLFFSDQAQVWQFPRSYLPEQAAIYSGSFFIVFMFFLFIKKLDPSNILNKYIKIYAYRFSYILLFSFVLFITTTEIKSSKDYSSFVSNHNELMRFLAENKIRPENIYFDKKVLEYEYIVPKQFDYSQFVLNSTGIEKETLDKVKSTLSHEDSRKLENYFEILKNKINLRLVNSLEALPSEEKSWLINIFKSSKAKFKLSSIELCDVLNKRLFPESINCNFLEELLNKHYYIIKPMIYKFESRPSANRLLEEKILFNYFLLNLDSEQIFAKLAHFWIDQKWIFNVKIAEINTEEVSMGQNRILTTDGTKTFAAIPNEITVDSNRRYFISSVNLDFNPIFKTSKYFVYEIN